MRHSFYSGDGEVREAVSTNVERCATCERWKRVKDWHAGSCGKRGTRTDEGDWCRFFKPVSDAKG